MLHDVLFSLLSKCDLFDLRRKAVVNITTLYTLETILGGGTILVRLSVPLSSPLTIILFTKSMVCCLQVNIIIN